MKKSLLDTAAKLLTATALFVAVKENEKLRKKQQEMEEESNQKGNQSNQD